MTTIQLRRDTATNWSTTNPILSSGEAGYDTTNKLLKIGDGATAWNNLASLPAPSEITELGNELNQLASTVTGLETSKQDTITDLSTIRNGASLGATALQPGANISDLTNDSDYLVNNFSNLSSEGLDKINQSKALETGNVSSDADVYADVLKYAHSTFDLSKFTMVGSPNITGDGIASGFGIGNYLKIANLASAPQDSLIVSIEFTPVQNTTDGRAQCLFIICSDDPAKRIYLYVQQSGTNVSLDINRTVVTTGAVNINSVNTAKVVWNKVDSTHGKFSLYVNDNLIGTQEFNTSDVIFTNDFNVGFFGSSALTIYYGSIDLKSFSITADGVPVFSGNKTGTDTFGEIEIPYTQSKTGSKIVDAAYRDRVQDVYEQYGVAMYYTIDEENRNFTLPMGEIYGMIEKKNGSELPVASNTTLGGVKIGSGVTITSDGTLSVGEELANTPDEVQTLSTELDTLKTNVNNFKFWKGTQEEYNGISTKDPNTLYIITG